MRAFRKTMPGGLLILLPVIVVAIMFVKVFQVGMSLTLPMAGVLHIEGDSSITLTHLIAALSIVAACYWCRLARHPAVRKGVDELDDTLTEFLSGCMFRKTMVISIKRVLSTAPLARQAATE